jgi:hypothetical protein
MKATLLAACFLTLLFGLRTLADDEEEAAEDESLRCINARSIRGSDVIDDNHVLFELQGRRLYLNALPNSCVGLSRDRRFSFETHTRSLCALDKIRVLREAGGGVYAGRACSLGRFQPVTAEDLVVLFPKDAVPTQSELSESADVEDVVTE